MMHTYLRTIGFSELKNRAEVEKLLSKVVKEATERRILKRWNCPCRTFYGIC